VGHRTVNFFAWVALASAGLLGYVALERADMSPTPGTGRAATVGAYAAGSDEYRFLTTHNGRPATWRCDQTIDVAVRRGGVGDDVIADLTAAMDTLSSVSRFSFRYVGETDVVPDRRFDSWRTSRVDADVVVAFVERSESDLLAGHAAANGGGDWRADGGVPYYTSGSVVVDAAKLGDYQPGAGFMSRQALFTHELAHVLNLSHIEHPESVLTSKISDSYGRLGAGDIAGLNHLSALACG
jgi:hypothetical protein